MRTKDFSVGDRVELDWTMRGKVDSGPDFFEWITGTVAAIEERNSSVGVRWDFDRPDRACHTLDGNCENGYGWWVPPDTLLPINDGEVSVDPAALLTLLSEGG